MRTVKTTAGGATRINTKNVKAFGTEAADAQLQQITFTEGNLQLS